MPAANLRVLRKLATILEDLEYAGGKLQGLEEADNDTGRPQRVFYLVDVGQKR